MLILCFWTVKVQEHVLCTICFFRSSVSSNISDSCRLQSFVDVCMGWLLAFVQSERMKLEMFRYFLSVYVKVQWGVIFCCTVCNCVI